MNVSLMALLIVAAAISLGLCAVGGMTKVNVTSHVWTLVAKQIATVWLALFLVFIGWRLWQVERGDVRPAPIVAAQTAPAATPAAESSSAVPAQAPPAAPSNYWLRWLLWLNLCLALPWITAFATRYVLALRSNAASFSLLAAYTLSDLALGMLIPRFAFAGGGGVMRLVGLVALCLGYNYWACELVASLWVGRHRKSP